MLSIAAIFSEYFILWRYGIYSKLMNKHVIFLLFINCNVGLMWIKLCKGKLNQILDRASFLVKVHSH